MKTLVLNCGSSSLKFQLFDSEGDRLLAKGLVEKIGSSSAILTCKPETGNELREIREISNHDRALKLVLNSLTDQRDGVIGSITEIDAVGHRVVHGGEHYSSPVLVDDNVIEVIKRCSVFAPLHNPANLMGIQACAELIPGVKQVAVFDTAFHQQIPRRAYLYGLPYAVYEKLGIRRYGFHGTSHWFVSRQAAVILGRKLEELKMITCHLGNGASIAAIQQGVSIDTSMGFTPLEGLMMGTRCGDMDPAIVPYLMEQESLSSRDVDNLMNKSSGLRGISRTTNDMREVEEEAAEGSGQHLLALEMFCYRIKKYIGSYFAALGGADAIVFTAGVGENSATVRRMVCEGLECLGISIDPEKNQAGEVSVGAGPVAVLVVPTNEELAIAQKTLQVLRSHDETERKQQGERKIKEELDALSEADKAQIAILWSGNRQLSPEGLLALIEKERNLKLLPATLLALLANMGITPEEAEARS